MTRNTQLAFRTPEPTSIASCAAFNTQQVNKLYDNLWNMYSKYGSLERPGDTFNMDETRVKTSAVSTKGKK
jgi:hypothetical protein